MIKNLISQGEWWCPSTTCEVVAMPSQVKIGRISGINLSEAYTNAHAVAAVPEMLEALESLDPETKEVPDEFWALREKALEKAATKSPLKKPKQ